MNEKKRRDSNIRNTYLKDLKVKRIPTPPLKNTPIPPIIPIPPAAYATQHQQQQQIRK